MPCTWSWKHKQGEILMDGNVYDLYAGNCLLIGLCRKQKMDDGEWEYYMPPLMFMDETHAKRCLGITKDYNGQYNNIFENAFEKITLYRNKCDKADFRKIVTLFAQATGNVNIEIIPDEPEGSDME